MRSPAFSFDHRLSSKAVAVHEAGHLFSSLVLAPTVQIGAVWIEKRGGRWHGMVERRRYLDEWEADKPRHMRTEVLVALAGPVAETRWRLRGRWNALFCAEDNAKIAVGMRAEAGEDFAKAVDHLEALDAAEDLERRFCQAWVEVEEVVHRHWRSIVSVAATLKRDGRIEPGRLFGLPEVCGVVG